MTLSYVREVSDSALLAFLCRAPVAVVRTAANGDIEMLTPLASRLLASLAGEGRVGNFFAMLDRWSPGLQQHLRDRAAVTARPCDGLRIALPDESGAPVERVLALSVFKLEDGRLLALLNEVGMHNKPAPRERPDERDHGRMTRATDAAGVGLFALDPASGAMTWNAQTFALFLPDTAAADATARAAQLSMARKTLAESGVTFSLGLAVCESPATTAFEGCDLAAELHGVAEAALTQARQSRLGWTCVHQVRP